MSDNESGSVPLGARVLGWLGVLPFAFFCLASVMRVGVPPSAAAAWLANYGVTILAFMGGVQWGLAMPRPGKARWAGARGFAMSVLPALIAFATTYLEMTLALIMLAGGFVILLVYDLATVRDGETPRWYGRLRSELTIAVVGFLLLSAIMGSGSNP